MDGSALEAFRIREGELDGSYWAENLRRPVRFLEVLRGLSAEGHGVFVEVSPHPVLVSALEEHLAETAAAGTAVGSLVRERPERASLLASLGGLHVVGTPIDWSGVFPSRSAAFGPAS